MSNKTPCRAGIRLHGIGVFFRLAADSDECAIDTGSGVRIGNDAETLRRTETSPLVCSKDSNL
jgi:hypothetical protein